MEIVESTDRFGQRVYRVWHDGQIIAEAYTEKHARVIADALEAYEREEGRQSWLRS